MNALLTEYKGKLFTVFGCVRM